MSSGLSGDFRTIKYNHLFLVDDENGLIPEGNVSGLGFYYLDTRFLSRYELKINDKQPLTLLSSTESGNMSVVVYTNNEIETETQDRHLITIPKETVMVKRESVLNEAWFEKFTIINYNRTTVTLKLSFLIEADFRDIFEVRSLHASTDGLPQTRKMENNELVFSYTDGVGTDLKTRIAFQDFEPRFIQHSDSAAEFYADFVLAPLEQRTFHLTLQPLYGGKKSNGIPASYALALESITASRQAWSDTATTFETDNESFNEILTRSHRDLRMLETDIREEGMENQSYIAAGIPWYVALFGRDSLITARSCLILKPEIAKSTLTLLARYQGKKTDPWRDEEPGKILHELRVGELARHGKIPHTPYYGSIDATPLWLILLFDYYAWTKDKKTVEILWPNALAALDWIDRNLNLGEAGYLGYEVRSDKGLYHQGWKDSQDSAMYEDGTLAKPPLYLCEVQGYVYLAKQRLSHLASLLGKKELAARLQQDCRIFKARFNEEFWMEDLKFCALALDPEGKPLRVISSNAGHLLETGILTDTRARQVANRLMQSDMFNGWGIRTLSSDCAAYNPMSYHNGSIWPHDNAMIAKGLATANRPEHVEKIFTALFDVGRMMNYQRIPELFCGFSRDDEGVSPVKYPVACSPQAWAAAAVYSVLQSSLRISPQWQEKTLILKKPQLPVWINTLKITNLRVGTGKLSLEFQRTGKNILVNVLDRQGNVDILVEV